jgi:hypothetical protein
MNLRQTLLVGLLAAVISAAVQHVAHAGDFDNIPTDCWPRLIPAACQWEWVCDGTNHCQRVPLCDNIIDIVPPQPPSLRPSAPPSIAPILSPTLPPLGTTRCIRVQRQGLDGRWYWGTVCH